MGAAAVAAARAIGYTNAGTVEFLLAPDGAFYFLEMNTRLQVEHPVTELVTGLDLVELQLRIAAGEPLPIGQEDVALRGHAIEVRLYAEAPHNKVPAAVGSAHRLAPAIRCRHPRRSRARCEGQTISPFYDPMLAKIIAQGATREEGPAPADRGARGHNRARHRHQPRLPDRLPGEPRSSRAGRRRRNSFRSASPRSQPRRPMTPRLRWLPPSGSKQSARQHGHDPARTWSSSGPLCWPMQLEIAGKSHARGIMVVGARQYRVEGGASALVIDIASAGAAGVIRFGCDRQERGARFMFAGDSLYLQLGRLDLVVRETLYQPRSATGAAAASGTELRAPMNGKVVAVLVAEGETVTKGQRLVVVEAMKMQHEMTALQSGRVARLAVKPGDQVANRQLLVELKLAE